MKLRTWCLFLAFFLGLSFFLTGELLGETWKAREFRAAWERAAWRFGPLRLQPVIVIREAGYDSNIYYHPEAISDFWLTAGPGLDAYLMVKKRLLVHVFESPQYVYFFKTERERTWNNYLNGEVSLSFNRFLLTAGGALNNARERWNTEIDIRPRRKEARGFVSLLYQRSYRVSLEITALRTDYQYESINYGSVNLGERLSHLATYWSGKFYYRLTPRVQFFLEGVWGKYDFKDPGNPGDSRSQTIYSGLDFSPTGRLRGQVRLGYKNFDTIVGGLPDFKGLVGDTSVSWLLFRPMLLRGSFRRDVNFSIWSNNPFYIGNSWSAGSSFYLFRKKIRLDYTYSQFRNDYPLGEVPGSEPRQDDYTLNSFGLYYRISKTAGIGLTGGFWKRRVNVLNWDAERRFVGLNLTYEF